MRNEVGGLRNLCLPTSPHLGGGVFIVLRSFCGPHEGDTFHFILVQPQRDKYFKGSTIGKALLLALGSKAVNKILKFIV